MQESIDGVLGISPEYTNETSLIFRLYFDQSNQIS